QHDSLSTRASFVLFVMICFGFVIRLNCAGYSLMSNSRAYFEYDILLRVFQQEANYDKLVYFFISVMFLFTFSIYYYLYVHSYLKLWSHYINDLVLENRKQFFRDNHDLIPRITWYQLLCAPRKSLRAIWELRQNLWHYPRGKRFHFTERL